MAQRGTVNSSLALMPSLLGWAKRTWCACGGIQPQIRQGPGM